MDAAIIIKKLQALYINICPKKKKKKSHVKDDPKAWELERNQMTRSSKTSMKAAETLGHYKTGATSRIEEKGKRDETRREGRGGRRGGGKSRGAESWRELFCRINGRETLRK